METGTIGVRANVFLYVGGKLKKAEHNIVTEAGLRELGAAMTSAGKGKNLVLTYGAIGTGTSTPSRADTQLGNEVHRVPVAVEKEVVDGSNLYRFLFGAIAERFSEIGFFIGDDASIRAGTGILFDRSLLDHDNTVDPEDIEIEVIVTFVNV